eukprot:m.142926 g.142926  ORF g.142926 m.142926 type:complete len:2982 (-) comp30282_c1_seq1:243-9188(-)
MLTSTNWALMVVATFACSIVDVSSEATVGQAIGLDLLGIIVQDGTLVRDQDGISFDEAVGSSSSDETLTDPATGTVVGLSFKPSQVTKVHVGLSSSAIAPPLSADIGVRLNDFGNLHVYESSTNMGLFGNYQVGDDIGIYVGKDGKVQVSINDETVYTMTSTPTFPLRAVLSIASDGSVMGIPVWVGKDVWCRKVSCNAAVCRDPGECSEGVCSEVIVSDGTTCNDNNASTTTDKCVSGECVGVDSCLGVDCGASDDCHEPRRCVFGLCYAGLDRADGTGCDDGDAGTAGDVCESGICKGVVVTRAPTTTPTQHPTPAPATPAPSVQPTTAPSTSVSTTATPRVACSTITCSNPDQCHEAMVCSNGKCFEGQSKTEGTICDDGNDKTQFDRCTDLGICVGVDLCVGVSCSPQNDCQSASNCVNGNCIAVNRSNGVNCDDGNSATSSDRCADGLCVGIDSCKDQECTPKSQCHRAGKCIGGTCSNPLQAPGVTCDDNDASTIEDVCAFGVCAGRDACAGVTCEPTACHEAGECVLGSCALGTPFSAGTECDDGDEETIDDQCDATAVCVGTDPCDEITCDQTVCHTTSTCSKGECSEVSLVEDFSSCDDTDPSTDNDVCFDGICKGTKNKCFNVDCPAQNGCQLEGKCNANTGTCEIALKDDGDVCDDSDDRTKDDICVDGLCVGTDLCLSRSIPCSPPVCQLKDSQYEGSCLHGLCKFVLQEEGTPCDDGDAATDDDECTAEGTCVGIDFCEGKVCPGSSSDCETVLPCRNGVCGAVVAENNGTRCDDGDEATDFDACTSGQCVGDDLCIGVDCGVASPCEVRSCSHGNCSTDVVADETSCDDGDINTINTTCVAGACIGIDLCAGISCPAISNCHVEGTCVKGSCEDGPPKADNTECDNGKDDVLDVCVAGSCVDVDPCTDVNCPQADDCHLAANCSLGKCPTRTVLEGASCDDGDASTTDDTCASDGECVGTDLCVENNVTCADQSLCRKDSGCFQGVCLEGTAHNDGFPCDDGNDATDSDSCKNGLCIGIDVCAGVDCGEQTDCFKSACVGGSCIVSAVADDTTCDDGSKFTDKDICRNGTCVGVNTCAPRECGVPSRQCYVSVCQDTECVEVPRDNGYFCNDLDSSTQIDQCVDGECLGTDLCADVTCAGDDCNTAGTCTLGTCSSPTPKADQTLCDDNNASTEVDYCVSGACNGYSPCADVSCAGETQCSFAEVCTMGDCSTPKPKADGLLCNDNAGDTYADSCKAGVCEGALPCLEGHCVAFTDHINVAENVNYGLTRIDNLNGWNSGAVSSSSLIVGDGAVGGVKFSPPRTDKSVVVGLGSLDNELGYQSVEHGLLLTSRADAIVFESGVFKARLGAYNPGDEFHIFLNKDNRVVYTNTHSDASYTSETVPEVGSELYVEVSIFDSGASVDNFEYILRQEILCAGIECRPTPLCNEEIVCVLGECTEATLLPKGAPCNDNNKSTDLDVCQDDGSCVGEDLCSDVTCVDFPYCAEAPTCERGRCTPCIDACENITCAPESECRAAEVCSRGQCISGENTANATTCDDGNDATKVDLCDGLGNCIGLDSCDRVGCQEPTQCESVVLCTGGACVPVFKVAGVSCDDGLVGTLDDACDGGGRCVGREYCEEKAVQCPLPDQCHLPTECFQGECVYNNRPDNTVCDDQDSTTRDDRCVNGACEGVSRCSDVECDQPTACIPSYTCNNGTCIGEFSDEGVSCDDEIADTENDFCDGDGACRGHFLEAPTCVQSVRCIGKDCDTTFDSQGTQCDDGNNATQNDVCDGAGTCVGVDLCNTKVCVTAQCFETSTCFHGVCSEVPSSATTRCDDGDALTNFDTCDGNGKCAGVDLCEQNGVVCEPGECETAGRCENGICVARAKYIDTTSCDDSNNATLYDRCLDGVCVGVDLCTDVTCQAPKPCRKPSTCFLGECSAGVAFSDGTECDDGEEATDDDRCLDGACVGVNLCEEVTCPPPDLHQCLEADVCAHGSCVVNQRPTGTPCDDGNNATDNDACDSGTCAGVDLCVKFDVTCTRGQCEQDLPCANGACLQAPPKDDGIVCDDGDENTVDDECVRGVCEGTNPCDAVSCAQSSCFETSVCHVVAGTATCTQVELTDGTACDDGDAETKEDTCNGGTCVGLPFTCVGVTDAVVEFSESECGGFDTNGVEWSASHLSSDCLCFSEFGIAFGEIGGKIKSSTECAQAICEMRELPFVRCNYAGVDVSEGTWMQIQGVDFVQVPYSYRSTVCNISEAFTTTAATTTEEQSCTSVTVTAPTSDAADTTIDLDPDTLAQGATFLSQAVYVGETVDFKWLRTDRVIVQSCECDTCDDVFPKAGLFSTKNNIFDETYRVRFDNEGVVGYRVDVVTTSTIFKYVGYITITTAPTTTPRTLAPGETTTATPTTTPDRESVNLLDAKNHDGGDDATQAADGSEYYEFNSQFALNVRSFPTPSNPVSFAMTFKLDRSSSGYLFALCNDLGGRFMSLYVSSKSQRLSFYYKVVGSNLQRAVHFNVLVNTGFEYRLLLSVDATSATVEVKGTATSDFTSTQQLVGEVDSCDSSDTACNLLVGARVSANGGIAHGIRGSVYTAIYYPNKVGAFPVGTFVGVTTTGVPEDCPSTPFNLLADGGGVLHGGAVALGDGSYSFDGSGYVELTQFPESVGGEWSVGMWVQQTAGTSGYLFAKTDSSGARRFYSLYSSGVSNKVSMYYRAAGQRLQSVFNVDLSDGRLHRVVLSVKQTIATLQVDSDVTLSINLAATPVEDCGARGAGCFFSIGQRMSPSGGAYQFTGKIFLSAPFSHCRVIEAFEAGDVRLLNVLENGGPQDFTGSRGTQIDSFRAITDTSYTIAVKATAEVDSRGYFISKSNPSGTLRRFALYGNPLKLTLYYKPKGSSTHESLSFPFNAFDGVEHSMLLSVNGTTAVFRFDSEPAITSSIKDLDDCGATDNDCVLYVGQRADTTTSGYPLTGTIALAEIYYQTALTQFP